MTDTSQRRAPGRSPASYEQQSLLNVWVRQRRDTEGELDGDGVLWALDDAGVALDGAAANEFHDRFAR